MKCSSVAYQAVTSSVCNFQHQLYLLTNTTTDVIDNKSRCASETAGISSTIYLPMVELWLKINQDQAKHSAFYNTRSKLMKCVNC